MEMGKLVKVATDKAPAALGAYSQAVVKGMPTMGLVYASGQLGLVPETGEFAGDDVESQTRQAMENLKAVLESAGSGLDKLLKVTIFMTDIANFQKINSVYAGYIEGTYPARSAVQVAALPKGGLVEIDAEAYTA